MHEVPLLRPGRGGALIRHEPEMRTGARRPLFEPGQYLRPVETVLATEPSRRK
jgi:hypothetical protein